MNAEKNFFIFNKETEWRRGYSRNLSFTQEGFSIQEKGKGHFWSRVLDSREKEMLWHRLRVSLHRKDENFFSIKVYASDSKRITWKDESFFLEELLLSEAYTLEEKKERLASCFKLSVSKKEDVLLHQVQGRYLWFCLEMEQKGEDTPVIHHIRIDFPKRSWTEYLPEVYVREEKSRSFLERYLGIFSSPYEDRTERIEHFAEQMDPDSAKEEFLPWLAQWLALEDASVWSSEKLRYLLKNAMKLYQCRGTKAYLKEMLRLYTGREAYVVEYHEISRFQKNSEVYERLKMLYGDHPYLFTVIVNMEEQDVKKDYYTLTKIVEQAVPAYMEYRIVQLSNYIFLDQYSYLGINSSLGRPRPLCLNGLSAVDFSRIEQKSEGEEV